jgi:S1-C subfamily serine protease
MTALSRNKPGDQVPVVVLRGEQSVTLSVSLVSK